MEIKNINIGQKIKFKGVIMNALEELGFYDHTGNRS